MIYFFNPGHETAVMNGSPYYTAPANLVSLQNDLAYLVALYASSDDYVFTYKPLPKSFRRLINNNLYPFPKTITQESMLSLRQELVGREVNLWGISPQSIHFFRELSDQHELNLKIPTWNDRYVGLCSRMVAKDCLEYISKNSSEISLDLFPRFYSKLDEIEDIVAKSKFQLLAKAPYSSSGRGLLWLPIGDLSQVERQILHGFIKKQGSVSVERVVNKKVDFAMEFICQNGNVRYEGFSLFETNTKGGYSRNILASENEIGKYLNKFISSHTLEQVKKSIIELLSREYAPLYDGFIGVDMMVYESNETYCLHPCVEINMRSNMGIIALNITRKILVNGGQGYFQIDFSANEGEMLLKHKEMQIDYPLIFESGKLKSGYLSLCPINVDTKYRAYVVVNDSSNPILQ